MTCPDCGCTVGWDCECRGAQAEARGQTAQDEAILETACAYGLAVLSRLAQDPAPAVGARAYAEGALGRLEEMLAAGGLRDQVEARVQELPRALLARGR